jgi:hypothetical protein
VSGDHNKAFLAKSSIFLGQRLVQLLQHGQADLTTELDPELTVLQSPPLLPFPHPSARSSWKRFERNTYVSSSNVSVAFLAWCVPSLAQHSRGFLFKVLARLLPRWIQSSLAGVIAEGKGFIQRRTRENWMCNN